MKIRLTIPQEYMDDTINNSLLNAAINKPADSTDWFIMGVNEITKTNSETFVEAYLELSEYFMNRYGKQDCFTVTIDDKEFYIEKS